MKRLIAVLVVAAVVALGVVPQARGQYYTPLRYDLRYTSPSYIPSGAIRYGPVRRPDPYRFGAPLYGNLGVTGNLRAGKSFRGTTPYSATGSQLTRTLPSSALSNFRRDSVGIGDIGTGVEYGLPTPYYDDTASVTTPWTAGQRFRTPAYPDRSRYLPPNFNTTPALPSQRPANIYDAGGGWRGWTLDDLEGVARVGSPAVQRDFLSAVLGVPASLLEEWETGSGPSTVPAAKKNAFDLFRQRLDVAPGNLFDETGRRPTPQAEKDPFEETLRLQYEPAATDLDASSAALPATDALEAPLDVAPAPLTEPGPPEGKAEPNPSDLWPAEAEDATGLAEPAPPPGPSLAAPLVPAQPTSPYAVYVLRAHRLMKEGQYTSAEALYGAAQALERDRPAALFGRVHALLGARLYLQAAAVLERAFTEHPDWVKAAPPIRGVYPRSDVVERILDDVAREAARGGQGGRYRFLLGYLEFVSGDLEKARADLEAAAAERTGPPRPEKVILEAIAEAAAGSQ